MPSDLVLKALNTMHKAVVKLSFGHLGWDAGNMPVVELTTTGRKSGQPRTVMLTSPLQKGDEVVLVASKGGADQHPAWYLNITADPSVRAKVAGGPEQPMTAHVASADERPALWDEVTTAQPRYAGYQQKTEREIPLVVLRPE